MYAIIPRLKKEAVAGFPFRVGGVGGGSQGPKLQGAIRYPENGKLGGLGQLFSPKLFYG